MVSRQQMYIDGQNTSANDLIRSNLCDLAVVKTMNMEKSEVDNFHSHPWHQLLFPIIGLLQTQVRDMKFLVPHSTSVFVPAGVIHKSIALANTHFMGLYFNPDLFRKIQLSGSPIFVSEFIKLLLTEIKSKFKDGNCPLSVKINLINVLIDQIESSKITDFKLLIPEDRRIKHIFDCYTENPSLELTLDEWSRKVGATKRTLTRLFSRELGTSFSLWRQNLRLVSSLRLLELDLPINEVAFAVGYQNDSSYIKAFREKFGVTPLSFKNSSLLQKPQI